MEDVIVPKFHSFLYHILNKHKGIPNKTFNKCADGENIEPCKVAEQRYATIMIKLNSAIYQN